MSGFVIEEKGTKMNQDEINGHIQSLLLARQLLFQELTELAEKRLVWAVPVCESGDKKLFVVRKESAVARVRSRVMALNRSVRFLAAHNVPCKGRLWVPMIADSRQQDDRLCVYRYPTFSTRSLFRDEVLQLLPNGDARAEFVTCAPTGEEFVLCRPSGNHFRVTVRDGNHTLRQGSLHQFCLAIEVDFAVQTHRLRKSGAHAWRGKIPPLMSFQPPGSSVPCRVYLKDDLC